ncbi:MAG TPA: hypothetical protein P5218_12615, partial [Planctomycetota bacterium]|nr:hypothetical protein [Planctomycetota bacterium]
PYVQASASGARTFGHPILMGPELVAALRALDPDTPLSTLRAQAHPLLACAVTRVEIVEDLDTPADFDRLCKADRDPL